ncbi:hypothetical protein MIN45_P1314 [Methylomarinovum tepidoasis]|uniref:PIN domain-containing protein n=1 Tax=Methylomarinovum tepidoasis TaxID=2840183 RepID=A0AAU9D1S9_9GAMM|nr:type II toxin-antitoxin system VapC family toxin [Methylomarinovum sp. IN45]BCX88944.1 hypothetical protein MIN45_P1314 [Methylomarinovum sp. IN45]
MNLLLDTCTFLWMIWDEPKIRPAIRKLLIDPDNTLFLSTISLWEATAKYAAGRLEIRAPGPAWRHLVEQRDAHDIRPLLLDETSVAHVETLPFVHKDPFDRLLICQAIEHGLAIVTPDDHIRRYPIKTVWE